jgi:hypothetical protein
MAKGKKIQTSAKNVERRSSDASTISELPDKENQQDNEQSTFSSRATKGGKTVKKIPRSLSKKSGLVLPVFQILKTMKSGNYADLVQKGKKLHNYFAINSFNRFIY